MSEEEYSRKGVVGPPPVLSSVASSVSKIVSPPPHPPGLQMGLNVPGGSPSLIVDTTMVNVKVEKIEAMPISPVRQEMTLPQSQITSVEDIKVKEEENYASKYSSLKNLEYFERECVQSPTLVKHEVSHNTLTYQLITLRQLEKENVDKRMAEFKEKEKCIDSILEQVSKETEEKIAILKDIDHKNDTIAILRSKLCEENMIKAKEIELKEEYRKKVGEKVEEVFELEKTISSLSLQLMTQSKHIPKKSNEFSEIFSPSTKIDNQENFKKKVQKCQYNREFLLLFRSNPMSQKRPTDLPDMEKYKRKIKSTSKEGYDKRKTIKKKNLEDKAYSRPIPCRNGDFCTYGILCTFYHDESFFLNIKSNRSEALVAMVNKINRKPEKKYGSQTSRKFSTERRALGGFMDEESDHPEANGRPKLFCNYCHFSAFDKRDLEIHKRKHSDNPTICDICGKVCANDVYLRRHKKFKH